MSTPPQGATFRYAYCDFLGLLEKVENLAHWLSHLSHRHGYTPNEDVKKALSTMEMIQAYMTQLSVDRLFEHMDTTHLCGHRGSPQDFEKYWKELGLIGSEWHNSPKNIKWGKEGDKLKEILHHLEHAKPRGFEKDYAWKENVYDKSQAIKGDGQFFPPEETPGPCVSMPETMSRDKKKLTFRGAYDRLLRALENLNSTVDFLERPTGPTEKPSSEALKKIDDIVSLVESLEKDRIFPYMDTANYSSGSPADFKNQCKALERLQTEWHKANDAESWKKSGRNKELYDIVRHLQRARPYKFRDDHAWVDEVFDESKAVVGDHSKGITGDKMYIF